MESVKHLYYSPTIKYFKRKRIRYQLEKGKTKLPSDIHPIIMRKEGANLFQFISLDEYYRLSEISDGYLIIGAVKSYKEFMDFVTYFFNLCIRYSVDFSKTVIIELLMNGENFYDEPV